VEIEPSPPPSQMRRSPRNLSHQPDPPAAADADGLPLHADAKKTADKIAYGLDQLLKAKGLELPADLPRGPWRKYESAAAAVSAWALGHGFKLIKDSGTTPASARSGAKNSLACSFARAGPSTATLRKTTAMGEHGDKCPFRISFEESTTGWVIYSAYPCHSAHTFKPVVDDATADMLAAGAGKIPERFLERGKEMRDAGFSAEDIDRLLKSQAKKAKLPAVWTIDDVYNTFCRDGKDADSFDAQKFIETLKENEKEYGLPYELRVSKEGALESVFWLNKTGFKHWAALGEAKCVLYDTKHGTNRYEPKLGCWTVVDCNGITRIVACSLIPPGESKEDFTWAFNQFRKHLGAPTVIFTDGDVGMAGAIVSVFGGDGTVHLLCLYHVYTATLRPHAQALRLGHGRVARFRQHVLAHRQALGQVHDRKVRGGVGGAVGARAGVHWL
jgi:hypothetical protein